MPRITTANISYNVKGALQPRSSVDMTKLTGPFDRVVATQQSNPHNAVFGIGGGEILVNFQSKDDYISFEIDVPAGYTEHDTISFGNVSDSHGGATGEISFSTKEGDFSGAALLPPDNAPHLYVRTFSPTGFYHGALPGTRTFVNIRPHRKDANDNAPCAMILVYQGGKNAA